MTMLVSDLVADLLADESQKSRKKSQASRTAETVAALCESQESQKSQGVAGKCESGTPIDPHRRRTVEAALAALGEDDPQTRSEVLARCATDSAALAFWTSSDRMPDPRDALYRSWLAGITEPRALVTLDDTQAREAIAAGVVSRETARASVLVVVRAPAGDLGPGAVGLLAIPRDRYRDFSTMAAVEALGLTH